MSFKDVNIPVIQRQQLNFKYNGWITNRLSVKNIAILSMTESPLRCSAMFCNVTWRNKFCDVTELCEIQNNFSRKCLPMWLESSCFSLQIIRTPKIQPKMSYKLIFKKLIRYFTYFRYVTLPGSFFSYKCGSR